MDCLHDIAHSDEDLLIGFALDGEALSAADDLLSKGLRIPLMPNL